MRARLASVLGIGVALCVGCGSSSDEGATQHSSGGSKASGGQGGSGGTNAGGAGSTPIGGGSGGVAGVGASGGAAGAGGVTGGGGVAGAPIGGAGGGSGGGSASAIKTVWVIVMENKAWCELAGSSSAPYINGTLLKSGAFASNYSGPLNGGLHPSEPNYIWMEAGDALGINNDNDPAQNHQSTTDHLVNYLDKAGVTWKSYQEDISGTNCPLTSVAEYKPKHNPNVFFDDVTGVNDASYKYCIDHNRPLSELATDLANGTSAQYNFVTPNMCNDMHDACPPLNNSIKQGDEWLKTWIPKFQASPQYQNNGVVILTFDESESTVLGGNLCCVLGNCPIGLIALSPLAKAGTVDPGAYDHSSFLKSMQQIFGAYPLLRHAGDPAVQNLGGLFTAFP